MPAITNGLPVNVCIDEVENIMNAAASSSEKELESGKNATRSGKQGKRAKRDSYDIIKEAKRDSYDVIREADAIHGSSNFPHNAHEESNNIDMVMRWADSRGAYECVLIWAWVVPVCLIVPCAFINILLMTHVPPNHCTPPPTPQNVSPDLWINLTIPRRDNGEFKSCVMYDYPPNSFIDDNVDASAGYQSAALDWLDKHPNGEHSNRTTSCKYGHNFSQEYFSATAATEFGWVCNRFYLQQRVLLFALLGNLAGCVIFGALADKIGRKKVFLLLSMKVAILGSVYVFLESMWLVLLVRFVISMGLPIIYEVVIVSALEQVKDDRRGLVTSISSVFFSLGQCTMALLAWLTTHWVTLGLVTSLPCLLALGYIRLIEESPRWLIARGKVNEAAKVIRRIARMNDLKPTLEDILTKLRKDPRKEHKKVRDSVRDDSSCSPCCSTAMYPHLAFRRILGSLLTTTCSLVKFVGRYPCVSFRMVLLAVCWTVNQIIYFSIFLKYAKVFTNPFLGFFFTSIIEVPANLLVPVLLRKVGRRPLHTGVMSLCSASLMTTALLLALEYDESILGVKAMVLLAKFCTSITFLLAYLQAAELHPTPIRTCANGVASLVALAFNVATPTIVGMAKPWHSYLVLGCIGCTGALCASLLPETAGRHLHQTLEEAENLNMNFFGRSVVPEAKGKERELREFSDHE